jgi:outer membrane protein assembly factor BamD
MKRQNLTYLIFLGLLSVLGSFSIISCSSSETKTDNAEAAYKSAEQYDKDERYEEAIRRYQEVKNKYPYSKFALMSELAIADAYFKQESFAESQVAYQSFKDLHPKHAQSDFVTFRLALSYFNQLPSTEDRDLTLAPQAISFFDEVIRHYPNSEHIKEAQEKKQNVIKLQAEKEIYIADFYFKKQRWDSARVRYEGGLRRYPGSGLEAKALSRAAICAFKTTDIDYARKLLTELKDRFPNSAEYKEAQKEIK